MRWLLISVVVTAAGAYGLYSQWKKSPSDKPWKPNEYVWFVDTVEAAGMIWTLFALAGIVIMQQFSNEPHRLAHGAPWSLSIGPRGISTTGNPDRTITWDQVTTVGIEPVQNWSELYRYPGLHVRFVDGVTATPLQPAGWYYPSKPLSWLSGHLLCVLGPLSDQQHVEPTRAVALHAGARWRPKHGFGGRNPTPRATRS